MHWRFRIIPHHLEAFDGGIGRLRRLEPERRSAQPLDRAVLGLDALVEVFRLTEPDALDIRIIPLQLPQRFAIGRVLVGGDHVRRPVLACPQGLRQKTPGPWRCGGTPGTFASSRTSSRRCVRYSWVLPRSVSASRIRQRAGADSGSRWRAAEPVCSSNRTGMTFLPRSSARAISAPDEIIRVVQAPAAAVAGGSTGSRPSGPPCRRLETATSHSPFTRIHVSSTRQEPPV